MEYGRSMGRLSPLKDVVWSCIFQDMRGAEAMKEFINAVLLSEQDEPIEDIVDMKSQYALLAEHPGEKAGRLDVRVRTAEQEEYDIEVQLTDQSYFNDRLVYYGEQIMTEGVPEGASYQKLNVTRVISIMDFCRRPQHPDIVQPFGLYYRKPPLEAASDKIRFYNVELPKFRAKTYESFERVLEDDALTRWLYVFTKAYQSEEEMSMLSNVTAGMENFRQRYGTVIADPAVIALQRMRDSAAMEEASRLAEAREKGMMEGLEKGMMEGLEKGMMEGLEKGMMEGLEKGINKQLRITARQMSEDNLPAELIARYLHISVPEVETILHAE